MTGRQKRVTSREQAFCSSGVPLRACWAKASDETGIDNRKRPKRTLRIVFLHFGSKKSSSRIALRHGRDGFCGIADAAYRSNEKRTSTGKCGQICGGLGLRNNYLISNGIFGLAVFTNGCCRAGQRKARCLPTTQGSADSSIPLHERPL